MLKKESVDHQEEVLRCRIRDLSEKQRQLFYEMADKKMKDPDTYAVLNYLFIAGLHHFYLEKWARGLINLALFLTGIILLLTDFTGPGILLVAGVSLIELYALFQSQLIVKDHNNKIQEDLLQQCIQTRVD